MFKRPPDTVTPCRDGIGSVPSKRYCNIISATPAGSVLYCWIKLGQAAAYINATAPATWGVAIDVPVM